MSPARNGHASPDTSAGDASPRLRASGPPATSAAATNTTPDGPAPHQRPGDGAVPRDTPPRPAATRGWAERAGPAAARPTAARPGDPAPDQPAPAPPARAGRDTPAPAAPTTAATRRRARARAARAAMSELHRLVRTLEQRVDVDHTDVQRDLELLGDATTLAHGESRLRALTALLVTLSTYMQATADQRAAHRGRPDGTPARRPAASGAAGARSNGQLPGRARVNGAVNGHHGVNGGQVNGTRHDPGAVAAAPGTADAELAAACARYIARDLAARQLSEFTSAEGYRLARALARLGHVEEPVEQLLAEANRVRLHPLPLSNAVSHSPH